MEEKNNAVLKVKNLIKRKTLKYVAIGVAIILAVVGVLSIIIGIIAAIFSNNEDDGSGGYIYIGTGNIGYSSISITDEDLLYLYTVIIGERGGGTNEQMGYVASVVLNSVLLR